MRCNESVGGCSGGGARRAAAVREAEQLSGEARDWEGTARGRERLEGGRSESRVRREEGEGYQQHTPPD